MNNYIMLNNKKINLTPEQVREMEESFGTNKTELKNIPVGETFKVGDFEFVVLEHRETTPDKSESYVILKDFWKDAQFDRDSNDYKNSDIRKDLNENFYKELCDLVGSGNIIKHTVDLTADDGLKDYDRCEDNISLLTCDMYRKYVYLLKKYNPQKWWWLSTAYSTKSNNYKTFGRCVSDSGTLNDYSCSSNYGVRPFCILKSNIFESK